MERRTSPRRLNSVRLETPRPNFLSVPGTEHPTARKVITNTDRRTLILGICICDKFGMLTGIVEPFCRIGRKLMSCVTTDNLPGCAALLLIRGAWPTSCFFGSRWDDHCREGLFKTA